MEKKEIIKTKSNKIMPRFNNQVKHDDRIIWDNHGNSQKHYFIYVSDQEMVEKWKKDKSVPMVDVVESFDVFEIPQGGNTGHVDRPSRQELHSVFGTSDEHEIIAKILNEGHALHGDRDKHEARNGAVDYAGSRHSETIWQGRGTR